MGYFEDKEEEVSWGWGAPVKNTRTTDPVVLSKFIDEFATEDYKIFNEDIIQPGVLWDKLAEQNIAARVVSVRLDHDIVLKNHPFDKETVIRLYTELEEVYKYGITGFPEDATDWEWVVDYDPRFMDNDMKRWVELIDVIPLSDGNIQFDWRITDYPKFFDGIYSPRSHLVKKVSTTVAADGILHPDGKMYRLDQYHDWYMAVLRDLKPELLSVSSGITGYDLKYIRDTPEDTIIEEYRLVDTLARLLGIDYIPVKPLILSLKNKIADGKIVVPDTHRRISRRMR